MVTQNHGYKELNIKMTRAEYKAFIKWVLSEELDHFYKQPLERDKTKIKKGEKL